MKISTLWIFLIIACFTVIECAKKAKMKYALTVTSAQDCDSPDKNNYFLNTNFNVKVLNKTAFRISGEYSLKESITNDIKFHAALFMQKGPNEWSSSMFTKESPTVCSGLAILSAEFFSLLLGLDKIEDACELKAGSYKVDTGPTILRPPNFSTLPFGKFRLQGSGGRDDGTGKFCVNVDVSITPP